MPLFPQLIEKIILQNRLSKRRAQIFSGSSRTNKGAPRKTSRSLNNTNKPEKEVSILHWERSTITQRKSEQKKGGKKREKRLQQRTYLLLEKLTTREVAGEVFDAIKTNNSFTSIATTAAELTGKQVRRLHLDPLLWLIEKAVFNKNITRTLQVVVVSLNEKSTEDSSSNEDYADKSDEEDIQELTEEEIQESVEDVQESVKGGVQEATKEALGDEAVTLN